MPRYQIPRSAEKSQDKEERTVIMSDAPIAPEGLKLLKVHKNPPTKS